MKYFKGAVQRIREAQAGLDVPIQVGIGIDITGTGIRVGTLAKVIQILLSNYYTCTLTGWGYMCINLRFVQILSLTFPKVHFLLKLQFYSRHMYILS